MIYDIIISDLAKSHLKKYYDWYESQKESLGKEFRTEVKVTIDKLSEGIVDYHFYKGEIRKTSLHRFPYYVYYERLELTKEVVILAVLHFKMNPNEITRLLD